MLARPFAALSLLSPAAARHVRRDRRLRRMVRAMDPARSVGPGKVLAEAWRRWRTRRMIADLDNRMLRDIGATWNDARAESAKPFWRA